MQIFKEFLHALMIILLLNTHVINCFSASKIGEQIRINARKSKMVLNAEKSQTERLKTDSKKKDFGLTIVIIALVAITIAAVATGVKKVAHNMQREAIKNITEMQRKLFYLNLEMCASSSIANINLRSTLAFNFISLSIANAGLDKTEIKKIPAPTGKDKNGKPLPAQKKPGDAMDDLMANMNALENPEQLSKLEARTQDICAMYGKQNADTLEKIQAEIQSSYDSYSGFDEIMGLVSIICNILNDVAMVLTGVDLGSAAKPMVAFAQDFAANSNVYRYINGGQALIGTLKGFVDGFRSDGTSLKDKLKNGLQAAIVVLWGVFYILLKNDHAAAIIEIINSIVGIVNTCYDFFKGNQQHDLWDWLQFLEDLSPDLRTVMADIPNATNTAAATNQIFGMIALVLDCVQVVLKLINAIGAVVKVKGQVADAEQANKEMTTKKIIEGCKNQLGYLDYIMDLDKDTQSISKELLKTNQNLSTGALNKKIKKACQTSPLSCVQMTYQAKEKPTQQIFPENTEYKDMLYNMRRGPVHNFVISNTFANDDSFMSNAYRVVTRTYMNMNNILYCKGCRNNIVIRHICLYDRQKKQFNAQINFPQKKRNLRKL